MSADSENVEIPEPRGISQRMLDGIEKVGNKVPHPVLMFLYLIVIVMVLSHVLHLFGVSVTEEIAVQIDAGAGGGLLRRYDRAGNSGKYGVRMTSSSRLRSRRSLSRVC